MPPKHYRISSFLQTQGENPQISLQILCGLNAFFFCILNVQDAILYVHMFREMGCQLGILRGHLSRIHIHDNIIWYFNQLIG